MNSQETCDSIGTRYRITSFRVQHLILRYIVKVDSQNPNMPGNLYLLLGDETLELTMKTVETMR